LDFWLNCLQKPASSFCSRRRILSFLLYQKIKRWEPLAFGLRMAGKVNL